MGDSIHHESSMPHSSEQHHIQIPPSPSPGSIHTTATAVGSIREPSLHTMVDTDPSVVVVATQPPKVEEPSVPTLEGPSPSPSNTLAHTEGPPPLDYDLRKRRFAITWFWTLILIDSIAIPIALYFGLWYGTDLSANAVFSISTACLGGVSIVEYFIRFYKLWKKGSTCRVLGARRWYLDWFHWNFSAAWFFIMCELIIGTAFRNPPIRLLAMPCSSLCAWFAFQLIVSDMMRMGGFPCPVRISSVPKGAPMRPGIYSIIEDVVAVDGSGDRAFRDQLNARFEASHDFRQMLHRLTLFWGFGAAGIAIVTTILIFTIQREAAYCVGWSLPFLWAGVWTACTFPYVKKCLRREKASWGEKQGRA